MASKLALRTLGAIALPGAFLAVTAPAASAVEVSPLSHVNAQGTTTDTRTAQSALESGTDATQGLNGLATGRSIDL